MMKVLPLIMLGCIMLHHAHAQGCPEEDPLCTPTSGAGTPTHRAQTQTVPQTVGPTSSGNGKGEPTTPQPKDPDTPASTKAPHITYRVPSTKRLSMKTATRVLGLLTRLATSGTSRPVILSTKAPKMNDPENTKNSLLLTNRPHDGIMDITNGGAQNTFRATNGPGNTKWMRHTYPYGRFTYGKVNTDHDKTRIPMTTRPGGYPGNGRVTRVYGNTDNHRVTWGNAYPGNKVTWYNRYTYNNDNDDNNIDNKVTGYNRYTYYNRVTRLNVYPGNEMATERHGANTVNWGVTTKTPKGGLTTRYPGAGTNTDYPWATRRGDQGQATKGRANTESPNVKSMPPVGNTTRSVFTTRRP